MRELIEPTPSVQGPRALLVPLNLKTPNALTFASSTSSQKDLLGGPS